MPFTIDIVLGDDRFSATGDTEPSAALGAMFTSFINAISDKPGRVQKLADDLNAQQDTLKAIVDTHKET